MAYVQTKTNAKGETVYKIRVSCGYTKEGKQISRSKTWKPEKSLSKRKLQEELNKQIALFELELANHNIQKSAITFEIAARDWFEYTKKAGAIKISSYHTYKTCQERTYNAIGAIPIEKLTKATVQKFMFMLSDGKDGKKPLATKSQKNYLTFISNVCNYAIDVLELIDTNPCKRVKCEKKPQKERKYYSIEEEISLLRAFREENVPICFQIFFMFLAYLGLRRGETLAIQWSDIDEKNGTVFIQKQVLYKNHETGTYLDTPKTKASVRNLKLPHEILDLLPSLKEEQENNRKLLGDKWKDTNYLFTGWDGKVMGTSTPYKWLKTFCEKENLEFKALHSFRHSTITNLIHNNVDIAAVSNIVGHANPNITLGIYTHEIKEATVYGTSMMSKLLSEGAETIE